MLSTALLFVWCMLHNHKLTLSWTHTHKQTYGTKSPSVCTQPLLVLFGHGYAYEHLFFSSSPAAQLASLMMEGSSPTIPICCNLNARFVCTTNRSLRLCCPSSWCFGFLETSLSWFELTVDAAQVSDALSQAWLPMWMNESAISSYHT